MEMSEVDHGANLTTFSQYPAEDETLWNACSYMDPLKGKEQWIITKWGPVKLIQIKMNANGKALTVEDLEMRRKTIVVSMAETFHADIRRNLETDEQKRQPIFLKAAQEGFPQSSAVRFSDIKQMVNKWSTNGQQMVKQ